METWIEKARKPWVKIALDGDNVGHDLVAGAGPDGEEWLGPFRGEYGWEVAQLLKACHEAQDELDRCKLREVPDPAFPIKTASLILASRESALEELVVASDLTLAAWMEISCGPWTRGLLSRLLVDPRDMGAPVFKDNWLEVIRGFVRAPWMNQFEGEHGLEVLKAVQLVHMHQDKYKSHLAAELLAPTDQIRDGAQCHMIAACTGRALAKRELKNLVKQ